MELLQYAIVGAIVSLFTKNIKKKLGYDSWQSVSLVIIASIIAGAVWVFFSGSSWWQECIKILAASSTVYSVLIKQLSE